MGAPRPIPVESIVERLERLWRKLDDDGRYTDANTVILAIATIRTGQPEIFGPLPTSSEMSADEAYDREAFEAECLVGEGEPDTKEGREAI